MIPAFCQGPGQAASKCSTMVYWLFWIEAIWETAGATTLRPSSDSPKQEINLAYEKYRSCTKK